ncbi:antitoxin Xre/MbcA/ParS toxin-binding domain-containing protein [Halomonas chromatireducens]|uniref:Antitoxin Xre/MbcA/ParS-like toxin-binding domain-containing protein n=1 Tax=Halomonas chromatireducens TaxID=507626 RepID=A0A0X8HF82_9GAMM|nr:antitoxin Xre/MbcA/ParS toxin-binding domain-containing protein [Halomonas chromatireducens]AMD01545.1 hypothetical protein LOKO_02485 [Halomonas chromatireducens]
MELLERNGASRKGIMNKIDLPRELYSDPAVYIQAVREGISGQVLRQVVQALADDREIFARLMETNSSDLHRYYTRKSLGRSQSENLLDTLKLYIEAEEVFGDREVALEWLHVEVPALSGSRPVDLFDTFAGRGIVRQILRKISYGEFS